MNNKRFSYNTTPSSKIKGHAIYEKTKRHAL